MLKLDPPDERVLEEYENLDGVPQSLMDNAIFAEDEKRAKVLIERHVTARQGMVQVAQRYPTEEGQSSGTPVMSRYVQMGVEKTKPYKPRTKIVSLCHM